MIDIEQLRQDPDLFYQEAFKRNIGVLTQADQDRLKRIKVAVVGCGGVGGMHLVNLVRLGVQRFHIADMDDFEAVNIQRQYGAFFDTLGKNKAEVMKDTALAINPHIEIRDFSGGVNDKNIEDFLEGVDILLDGVDFFSVDIRRSLFMRARENGIYAVTAGPLGFGSAMLVFAPDGMSFDDYFDITDGMSYLQKLIAFAVGLAPAALHMRYLNLGKVDLSEKSGPALVSSCALCSSLAVTEVIRIATRRTRLRTVPHYVQFDALLQTYKRGCLFGANRNPWQRIKRWFLYRRFKQYDTDR